MKRIITFLSCALIFIAMTSESCDQPKHSTTSKSGVQETRTTVETDLNGNTVEQNNIVNRLKEDNKPGSIKHLYIISSYSGQVLMYSTVKGKVTSSGKRISPTEIQYNGGDYRTSWNPDLIQDDGTYGHSVDYVYWWDSKNVYHQQYITGGMMMHISNEPIAVKSVVINLELNNTTVTE